MKREGRHEGEHVKVQRVWHVAESEEQCGDEAAEIHQHDVKPHELCSEVRFINMQNIFLLSTLQPEFKPISQL